MVDEDTAEEEVTERAQKIGRRDYPLFPLDDAIKVAVALKAAGGTVNYKKDASLLASAMGMSVSGSFLTKVGSARNWGLIEGRGDINLTELGKKLAAPISEEERLQSRKEAYFNIPMFKELFELYKNTALPNKDLLANVLERRYDIPVKDKERLANLVSEVFEELAAIPANIAPAEQKEMPNQKEATRAEEERVSEKPTESTNLKKASYLIGKLEAYSDMETPNKEMIRQTLNQLVEIIPGDALGVIAKKMLETLEDSDFKMIKFGVSILSEIAMKETLSK